MNWLFRRHFWIVHLVFLSIIAIVLAKIFTTVMGYWLSKTIPEMPSATSFVPLEAAPTLKDFSIANERNLFGARREPVSEIDESEQDIDPGRWQDAGPSSLPLKLVSTMVFLDPFQSRATILNTATEQALNFSLGECRPFQKKHSSEIETVLTPEQWEPDRSCNSVFGMATLVRIEDFRVYIFNERSRKYEYLSLLEDDRVPIRRAPVAREESEEEEEGEGVRKVGATSYEIDQREFDKALSNVARLMTEARAVPETDAAGNLLGFKIAYLKEGSLFDKIGIEKSDVLTRINGYELNSNEKALQLFSKLRSADRFTIDIKRGDRSVTLDYTVVK